MTIEAKVILVRTTAIRTHNCRSYTLVPKRHDDLKTIVSKFSDSILVRGLVFEFRCTDESVGTSTNSINR